MVDMTLLQGAIGGLKTAGDIAVSLGKLNTMAQVNAKAIELQQIILAAQSSAFSAQSEQFSLIERIRDLEKELADIKAWETEKQRYKLVEPWTGSVAYALKKSMSNSEPPHYICTKCYEDGRKSILNQTTEEKRWTVYMCPVCKSKIPTGYGGQVPAEYAPE